MMGTNEGSSAGHRISGGAFVDILRMLNASINPQKIITACIEAVNFRVDRIIGKVVPAFSVFGFVVDFGAVDFHLSQAQIPLKICGVVYCVPETEFYIRGKVQCLYRGIIVCQHETVYLAGFMKRNKGCEICPDPVFRSKKSAVAQSVAALIGVQGSFYRLPSRGPYRVPVLDKVVPAVGIRRHIVIAVAGKAQELCVFIKAVASAGVRNQGEKVFVSQVIDPWKGSSGRCDDILFVLIIKVSEFHVNFLHLLKIFTSYRLIFKAASSLSCSSAFSSSFS